MAFFDIADKTTYSHNFEFRNSPIGVLRLIQDSHLNVTIIHWLGVVRPVLVALFSSFLETTRQHDNCSGILFPNHSPKIISSAMEGALSDDEFTR